MFLKLEETLAFHKDKSNLYYKIISLHDDKLCCTYFFTPVMQRALEIPPANEIIFVDDSGNCDVYNHKIYVLVI